MEDGNNKGIVVLVTSQKEGAITGGPAFIQAVGENILDATVTENLPGKLTASSSTSFTHECCVKSVMNIEQNSHLKKLLMQFSSAPC